MTTRPFGQLRFWVIAPIAAALLVAGGTSFVLRIGAVHPTIGVEWVQTGAGPLALQVAPESPAATAGMRAGDLLLEVEGRTVAGVLEASEMAYSVGPGSAVRVRVRRAGGEPSLDIRPRWDPRPEPYGYLAIVGLAFWMSGAFVALRWPEIRSGTAYAAFAASSFAQLTLSHTGRGDLLDWGVYWGDVIAGALTPALLLHVGVALTKRAPALRRLLLGSAYTASALMILAAVWLSPGSRGGAYRFADPLRAIEVRDRLEALLFGLSLAVCMALLVKSQARSSSVMHRGQMRWLLWGLAVGLGPYVLFAVPWALGAAELPEWAQFLSVLPMLLVPAAFTAALARYRLQDLDLLLVRGVSEVTTIFFTFGVYASAVFLAREAFGGLLPFSRSGTRYVGILVAAVSYPKVRGWVRAAVDRAFYRRRYSYRATLLDWARDLSADTDLAALLGLLRARVRDTLGVQEAEVLIRTGPRRFEVLDAPDSTTALELDDASLQKLEREAYLPVEDGVPPRVPWARYLFPMRVKGELRALLVAAEREPPDEPLTSEDRALLATLAAHAGTAIEAARLVQEVRSRAAEIERLHARQARILESSAVGLLLADGEGRILTWNRALEDMYGLPRGEALGRRLGAVFPLHVARRIESEARGPRVEEARIFRLNLVNRRSDGLIVNIAISPVEDAGPVADRGWVVTFDDVTARVKLEEQVLQQERLASLGLLAAGVAHEINTPLTGISSYAQMLLEEGPDERQSEILQKIETQTRRASRIANSLLNLARPERRAFEALDLNETIREVLQLLEPQVRGRDIQVRAALDRKLPPIPGHKGKLQQVLLNLLLNARDAVGERGEIRVATRRGKDRVVIEVTDDGVGISEDDLPRIFDPFFTTKGRGKGTGLGLSITYGIVQEHDGRIEATTDRGRTCFRVELPAGQRERVVSRTGS